MLTFRHLRKGYFPAWGLTMLIALTGCGSLQQDIDVDIPFGPAELVVEAYLEPGTVPRLTVTESTAYLSDPQQITLLNTVAVLIQPNGRRDTLQYLPNYDRATRRAYTHVGRRRLTARPGDTFQLEISDDQGRRLTGSATMPALVPLDNVEWRFNNATSPRAYVLASFKDPVGVGDSYRFMVHRRHIGREAEIEYVSSDRLFDGQSTTLGTSYEFRANDTLIVSLFHLDKPYADFLQSVGDAQSANQNPFAQPSAVRSTVTGGLGVFTILSVQRQRIILQ